MGSWKFLPVIERSVARLVQSWRRADPSREGLLDLALGVTLLPLLLVIKLPMLVYLLLAGLLWRRRPLGRRGLWGMTLFGIGALLLSMYGSLGFAGLSRFQVFLELILYLLLLAVTLQRLSGRIDRYLLLSPFLFLILSLFFFRGLGMLLYLLPEILVLLWIVLRREMRSGGSAALRMALRLFVLALPLVALLFLLFPRISFGTGRFGFRDGTLARTGHDGTMYLDGRALLIPSDRIVMEMELEGGKIPARLYLRGSVLYRRLADHWAPLPAGTPRAFSPGPRLPRGACSLLRDPVELRVKLYPTRQRWLYFPGPPLRLPKASTVDADWVVRRDQAVEEPLRYRGRAALQYRCGGRTSRAVLREALRVDARANPRSRVVARRMRREFPDPAKRLNAIEKLFRSSGITYTLDPGGLRVESLADDLLFGRRRGYCVHFSSAFVTLARMAGIPARIVTGYLVAASGRIDNYLAVRERDAHAWAEVYLDRHWQRVDPTLWATRIDAQNRPDGDGTDQLRERAEASVTPRWQRWELYGFYWRYRIEAWILRYDYLRRMRLLDRLREDRGFLFRFAGGFLLAFALGMLLYLRWRTPGCDQERTYCRILPLLERLGRRCPRKEGESVGAYLRRCAQREQCPELAELARSYEAFRYGGGELRSLEKAYRRAREAWRRRERVVSKHAEAF